MNSFKNIILYIGLVTLSSVANSQSITPWTEQNGTLGLGYPVPIPVDTLEPFDGFRTYDGLFAKHQAMALSNEFITGHIVGQTHYDRDIWAYVLSDENNTTQYGVKEGAMMANGGIHAREWQSPETLTQIITDFHNNSKDHSFYQYLLENTTIITIPINNIDGFLQTQRYPSENWYSNNIGPRDGRMRRKNLRETDEDLLTQNDFLNGVDLNRNNNPYWATSDRSSSDPGSIVYHGPAVQSEPETAARIAAANLVEADQLRAYTDVHSFSQVHFSVSTLNSTRNTLQARLLSDFTSHHRTFSRAKFYRDIPNQAGFGIGATDEYFAYTYEIPSWTLEIEPTGNGGVDYGGFGNNGHDGFILPESEIKRVREQLAESFMVVWYGQAGPPSITQLRIVDMVTDTIVFDAEWDINDSGDREQYSQYYNDILSGRDYALILRFDKPMRYRNESGIVTQLQGQTTLLDPAIQATSGGNDIELNLSNPRWVNQKDDHWESYGFYKDDTYVVEFNVDSAINASDDAELNWKIITTDMVGQNIDANPSTVVTWKDGKWINYEDSNGNSSINGGFDTTIAVTISNQTDQNLPGLPETAMYYDATRSGEGFTLELISGVNDFLIQWFTYDNNRQQQWYVDTDNTIAQNALMARKILTANGGIFGPDFDNADITVAEAGDIEMIFGKIINGTRTGQMKYTYPDGRKFRTQVDQLTRAKGISPTPINNDSPPMLTAAAIIGSWFDPTRNGEGFHIEQQLDESAIFVWYSYDLDGNKKWFIGSGGVVTETAENINITFAEVYTTTGALFGDDFNPDDVEATVWGSAEFNLSCVTGTFSYNSLDPDYGMGTYNIEPLTRPINNTEICD